jgi:phage terminase large subunit
MQFHPAQSEIAKDAHRFRVVICGRRFGKTTLSIYEMIGKAVAKDDVHVAYIAPTYQQARDISWQQLKKIVQPIATSINESRLEVTIKTKKGGTSSIVLRGWESVDTLRGQKFDFLVLDEVASFRNFNTGWLEVLRPTLTDVKGDCLFIGTPKGFNHLYDLSNKESSDNDYKTFHFTSYDNPFIPREEIDKTKLELTEDSFAQEYLADFRKTEGLVFKEFDRLKHLDDTGLVGESLVGIDFGYSNPSSVVNVIKGGNKYYVSDEWYKTQQTTEQIAQAAMNFSPNKCYPDPAEPDRIEILRAKGLYCVDVSKDTKASIDKLHEVFLQGRIKIHPRCENLIYELETYAYPDTKDGRNAEEKPIKHNDHAIDALRYAIYMEDRLPQYNGTIKTSY